MSRFPLRGPYYLHTFMKEIIASKLWPKGSISFFSSVHVSYISYPILHWPLFRQHSSPFTVKMLAWQTRTVPQRARCLVDSV